MIFGSTSSTVAAAATDIARLVSDPALPEVLSLSKQIYLARATASSTPTTTNAQVPISAGVGLSSIVPPLKAVLYAEQNPWAVPTAVAVALGVPLLFGFFLGRASKRT